MESISKQRSTLLDRISEKCRIEIKCSPHTLDVSEFFDNHLNQYLSWNEMMKVRYCHIWDIEKLRNPNYKADVLDCEVIE